MLELDRRLAEAFMRAHPGLRVEVAGGGSSLGVAALLDGRAEIAAVSRPLASDEVAGMHERFGTLGVRFLVARDALSVFVNAANPVRDLTLAELRAVFTGQTVSWSDIGGGPGSILVVVRPPTSGTHRFFRDHVLGGAPFAAHAVSAATTRAVLEQVAAQASAIGFGGIAYRAEGVAHVAVGGVAPTPDNVRRDRYPLSRYLSFVVVQPPSGLAQRFIDWCLGAEGQKVVEEVGYLPLWRRRR